MKPFLIREAKSNELYESLKVMYRAFDRSIPSNLDNQVNLLIELVTSNIAKFLIAEKNKKIFGLGGIFVFQEICSIGCLSVLPEFRNSGVGTTIFSKLINTARSLGCKTYLLYASKLGEPIYHKFGFRSNYSTSVYEFPSRLRNKPKLNESVKNIVAIPNWVTNLDKETMGFDRHKFLELNIRHGAKLIVIPDDGYALISGLRIGPIIAKNLHVAVELIKTGITLGGNHIILPKHSKLTNKLFDLIDSTEKENDVNLKMVFGKNLSQKLEYLYAIGTYAKG